MDIRERIFDLNNSGDLEEILRSFVAAQLRGVWTSMPVTLNEDSDGKTVKMKLNIKSVERDGEGKEKHVELPELPEVPVKFASGGGTSTTLPLKTGDEGLAIFTSRASASWRESGGVQQAVDARSHSLSDAVFVPGIRSKPRDLEDISTEGAETRSDDGKHRTITHPQNGVKVTVNGGKQVFDVNAKTGQTEIVSKTVTLAAGDAKAGRGPNTENTADRHLNEALKGLSARVGQVEKTAHALFDVTSKLRELTQIRVPEVAALAGLLNQNPGGLDAIVGAIEGKAQAYAQTQIQQALGMFLSPSIAGLGSVLSGGVEALIAGLEAQIAKLIEINPVLAQVDDLQRQAEAILTRGARPDVEAAQIKPVQDALAAIAKDNPAVGVLQGLQNQLKGLQGQAGPGLSFLEPQKQIAQGVIKSMRLSEGS